MSYNEEYYNTYFRYEDRQNINPNWGNPGDYIVAIIFLGVTTVLIFML